MLPPADGGDMGFPEFSFAGYEGLGSGNMQFAEYPVMEHNYSQAFTYIHGSTLFSLEPGSCAVSTVFKTKLPDGTVWFCSNRNRTSRRGRHG